MELKNVQEIDGLSPLQESVIRDCIDARKSGLHYNQFIYDLHGDLDVFTLEKAWQLIVEHHPVLRTFFIWQRLEKPLQVVRKQWKVSLEIYDWCHLSATEQETGFEGMLSDIRDLEFSEIPFVQLSVFQTGVSVCKLVLNYHRLVLDNASVSLVLNQLLSCYEDLRQSREPLLEQSLSYKDYINWVEGQDVSKTKSFFSTLLSDLRGLTLLGVQRVESGLVSRRQGYAEQQLSIPAAMTLELLSFVNKHELSLSTVVQSVWSLLLSRYSGEEDVVFGCNVSGRPVDLDGSNSMVGSFANTLPTRVRITPNASVLSWLQELHTQQLNIEQYAYSSRSQIQEWSQLPEDVFLFESNVVWGCHSQKLQSADKTYPMTVRAWLNSELTLQITYDWGRFDDATITRMLEHLQTLLEGIVARSERSLEELSLLTQKELQLLFEWNNTKTDYQQQLCIHQIFEIQAEKTPDAVALVFEDKQLTYGELNYRANQLANYLITLGVKPQVRVAICVERSLEMVIGLLGVLKAGGTYVPLDPKYPFERLSFILEDIQAPVLLTQEDLVDELPSQWVQVVCLDSDWDAIALSSSNTPNNKVIANNLAYVVYTSGSTGTPKGVLIAHQGLCNLVQSQIQTFDVQPSSRVLQFASFSFDASVSEIFMALCSGAMLCLGTSDALLPGQSLMQLLEKQAITHVTLPPSVLAVLPSGTNLDIGRNGLPDLHTIIVAGEACTPELARQWSQGRRFLNAYGPSEVTVCATMGEWNNDNSKFSTKLSIGRAISNTQVYILDNNQKPVPVGVKGEIYISSDGLAWGYLNRPELTAERFIPNPFSEQPGARFFRTGDLARYLPNGDIEFLGRVDYQVKIRGFRIETGEIEAILSQHPQVQNTVVIVREDESGNKQLIAYLVPVSSQSLSITQLRDFLAEKLPEYMIPNVFVMLETMPLSPNGKIDRGALPQSSSISLDTASILPRNSTEKALAAIWAEVLGLEVVGIHDNFFELGGHSLLGTQVISRLRETYQFELPLRSLFEFPTIAQLAKLLPESNPVSEQLSLIKAVARDRELPLSFAQQRLWFLDKLEGGATSYNVPGAVQLTGSLDITALKQAVQEIVHRHEVLRTSFPIENSSAVQAISPTLTIEIPVVDLQLLPADKQWVTVQQMAQAEQVKPFDLVNGPLLRVTLLKLGTEEHVLLLTMHHIISDGWSMGIFVGEVANLYEAFASGKPSPLAPLPIQYVDFAIWQRQWLSGEELQSQLGYWKEQLAGIPPQLELPTDRPHPSTQSYRGGRYTFALSQEMTQGLSTLSKQQGATLFMTMLATFVTLLARYSGQTDVVVGSPIANRNRREIESLIGFFVNTLVLRNNLEGNPTFLELLERVRKLTLDAYANQDVPFEQLVEVLQPERSLSHNPLFQVMFVLQNAPTEKLQLPGLNLSILEIENVTSKFDLTLSMEETELGLRGVWEYSSDLFDKPTIARMAEHFQNLLSAILSNPQQQLQSLPLLCPSEQNQLLADWNDTEVDYPNQSIDKLFATQVEKTPDAVAVVFADAQSAVFGGINQQLTYQELNTRANQLAHYLIGLGVKPEMLVGIYMERSIDMVVGILAILKAGGAYVPLEPTYPQERLQYMLSDSQVSVLLTQDKWLAQLPHHDAPVVCIDSDWQQISHSSRVNPVNHVAVENLAYVIYTSGSTGKPKGAMNTHKGVCNRLLWMQDSYKLTTADRVLQKTPFSFDVSVWEFLLPLLTGACLVVAKPGGHQDSAYLVELIIQQKITTVHFVPSMLRVFLEEAGIENCTSLRQVFSSGEALPTDIERCFFNRLGCELHNLYGPTEAAIDVTFWQCQPESKLLTVPIGYPISNTQIYILDPLLQPVPIGVKGELHVGGINLARGYFQRPELTAEKFIPNPFSSEPGARLYKTGDLARYSDNGSIEFIGRLDHQVKIRGFRIETGEIEAVLATHPAVRQSKVIVIEQPHKYLAAYIVSHQEQPTTSDLRQFLLKYLPDYMVPSSFVILDTLPLNSNGKLDIQALPAPDIANTNTEKFVSPRTRTEEVLVTIWREILGVEQVGIHDNFFELGGDSILSIQIVTRANQAGLQLIPKHLFQHQTIAELATAAIEAIPVQAQQELSTNPAPLLPIQQWFLEQNQPNPHHFNQSILLEIPANTKPELLQEVVEKLLQHHDALRLRFELINGDWQQQTTDNLTVPFTTFDFSDIPEEEQQQAIELTATDLQTSLDLFTGRVMQVAMFHLGEDKPSRLLFVIHHLVVDGVSWRILLEDFTTAYKQVSCGETIKLAPKTTSFQNWTNRLIDYSESEAITAELNYWLAKERSQILPLPVDYPGDGEINTVVSSAKVSVSLSEEQTHTLLHSVPAAYNTQINDVLLTAFMQSLQVWTNRSTVLVDLEGHGREELFADVNLSRTIGWFTTLFPVHLQLEKVNNPGEALKSVKEQLRCLPQRGIGYGILKYKSQNKAIRQQLEAFPQPEIIFNYLGQFDQMLTTSPLFKLAKESKGAEHSPHKKRSHLLEISAFIVSGQLQVDWTYCQKIHQRSTVEHLAWNFIDSLVFFITHCTYKNAKGYTPSDFTAARLNQKQLDKFIAKIKQNSSNSVGIKN